MESERRMSNAPWRFSLLVSVVVLNICLPSLVLSYGTLLIHSVTEGQVPWSSLITPAVYIIVYCITQCWCRDATDSWGGNTGYRAMATLGLLLVVSGVLTCAFVPPKYHPLLYGVLGGLGSSLISAQVEAVIYDTYDTRLGIVRSLCYVGQAIGLIISYVELIKCGEFLSSMESERRMSNAPWRFSLLVSVVVLNICLPSLVLSYGTLLIHSVTEGQVPWSSLITPAVYIIVYCITQCWCRDATDSWGGNTGYRAMATLGLLLVVSGVLTCAFVPPKYHPLLYGVLGGLGSSLISAQVEAVIYDTYDTRLGIVRSLCYVGQAIGQFIFPHILTSIIDTYGLPMTYLLLSGIMLHALPAILFLKTEGTSRHENYSRYSDISKTYAIFNNDIPIINNNEMQLHDLGSKSWKSPSDDSLYREIDVEIHDDNDYVDVNAPTITPPPSPEEKRHNIFGVEILPEIPEESEVSSDSDDNISDKMKSIKRWSAAIKRFSTLGDNLDEYIIKQLRKDSVADVNDNEFAEIDVVYDNISPMTDIRHEKVLDTFSYRCQSMYFNMKRRFAIPSYRWYRIKRRFLYILYSINDTFVKPLTRSLSCWRFYPALLLSFTKLSLTAISLPLLPLVSLQIRPKISMTEMNFLMSLHGFTWICFLLCTPWLVNTSRKNMKYPVVAGLVVSTIAVFLVSKSNSHDSFSVGCIVAGFGFGAITSCWETTVQEFVGARKWPKVNSTLETLSGTLLATFVICMSCVCPESKNIQVWFVVLGGILATATFVWLIIGIVFMIKMYVKKVRLAKS